MDSFVSPKSWVIFNKLNANSTWLQKDVDEWDADDKYERIKECLHYLKVVNDLAEPCLKETQEYADLAKYCQYEEDLLIAAADHRGVFKDLKKRALAA